MYLVVMIFAMKIVHWDVSHKERVHYLLGVFSNGGLENYKDGILYFDDMIMYHSRKAEDYAGLGACYFDLGDDQLAIAAYQKALRLEPNNKVFVSQLSFMMQHAAQKNQPILEGSGYSAK